MIEKYLHKCRKFSIKNIKQQNVAKIYYKVVVPYRTHLLLMFCKGQLFIQFCGVRTVEDACPYKFVMRR